MMSACSKNHVKHYVEIRERETQSGVILNLNAMLQLYALLYGFGSRLIGYTIEIVEQNKQTQYIYSRNAMQVLHLLPIGF